MIVAEERNLILSCMSDKGIYDSYGVTGFWLVAWDYGMEDIPNREYVRVFGYNPGL